MPLAFWFLFLTARCLHCPAARFHLMELSPLCKQRTSSKVCREVRPWAPWIRNSGGSASPSSAPTSGGPSGNLQQKCLRPDSLALQAAWPDVQRMPCQLPSWKYLNSFAYVKTTCIDKWSVLFMSEWVYPCTHTC